MTKFKKIMAVAVAILSISSISAVVYADNQPSLCSDNEAVINGDYANYYFSPTYAKIENITTTTRYMEASITIYHHNTDTQALPGSLYKSGKGNYVQVDGSSEYPAGKKYDYYETCSIYNSSVPYSGIVESNSCLIRAQ